MKQSGISEEGMHEIKSKRRPKVKKDRQKQPRLKTRRKMKKSTKIATVCLVVSLLVCAYSVGLAFFRDPTRNTVSLDYGSAYDEVKSGEVYSPNGGYSPIDVFARLNWTFSHEKQWYGEMHGTVDTVISQEIATYKQYNNGILISADLTRSSLVSGASQFCYLRDQDLVMWRKPAGGASTYQGLETEWKTGEPYRMMTIGGEDGFKAQNGLPAYELSVYVIEEDTVLSASDVTMTEDGLYRISYELRPDTWQEEDENGNLVTKGATAYYANQMIFTGGLPEAPVFDSISVSFVFDKNWRVHSTEIREVYDAKYGPIAAACVGTSKTEYEYDTARAISPAYDEYFKQYVDSPIENKPAEKEVTALNCLAEAFGSVLTQPTSLNVDLLLNGEPIQGVVDLDLSGLDLSAPDFARLKAKAQIGALKLYVQDGAAYLNYGGIKFRVGLDELVSLFGDAVSSAEGEENDLLGALAGGEFTVSGNEATLSSALPLAGVELPVTFTFLLDENKTASLKSCRAEITLEDKLNLQASLSFGEGGLPELTDEADYADILPYATSLAALFGGDALHADLRYAGEGVALSGAFDLKMKQGFALSGVLEADIDREGIRLKKTANICYQDGKIYLELDGLKVSAGVEEAISLLSWQLGLPAQSEAGELDLAKVLGTVLSEEFASRFASRKSDNTLVLLIEGSELLRSFGLDFDLGNVELALKEGELSASALGANITLTAGKVFEVDTADYIDILPYAESLIALLDRDNLNLSLNYQAEEIGLSISGELGLNLKTLAARGELLLSYRGATKKVLLQLAEKKVYLEVDGIKLSVSLEGASALLSQELGISQADSAQAIELLNRVLALNFGEFVALRESADTLSVIIHGSSLLESLGIAFDAGEIEVKISDNLIQATALGAHITVTAGEEFETDTTGYIEIVPYAQTILDMIRGNVLNVEVSYSTGNLSISGTIAFDISSLVAKADLTIAYKGAEKKLVVIYKEGSVYLELDGLKLSANVEEAIALVTTSSEVEEEDKPSKDLIEEILSLNFGELVGLSESEDTLTAAIDGTMLLNVFGLDFDLGNATVQISESAISVEVLGAHITVTAGEEFETDTTGYIEIVPYAQTILDLIRGNVLNVEVSYSTDNLSISGTIAFDISALVAKADLTLTYKGAEKQLGVIYQEGSIFLTLDGLKLSANVEEAIALVTTSSGVAGDDEASKDLIEELLSMDFGKLIGLSENENVLTAAIDGTMLLNVFGLDFDLGNATVQISESAISVEVLGAHITVTAGEAFEVDTADYIEIIPYAQTIMKLIQGNVLNVEVSYSTGDLSISGTIAFDISSLVAKADLTLTYKGAEKQLGVIYQEGSIFLTLDGLKLSANVEEAIALVTTSSEVAEDDEPSKDLIEEILSLNFGELVGLSENENVLTAAIDGTMLLNAFGLDFDLGNATVQISENAISVEVLGAHITITAGKEFTVDTKDYIEILPYAQTILDLIQGNVLNTEVSYSTKNLSISGTIEFDISTLVAKADLTLNYKGAEKKLSVIYKEGSVYLELDGLKLSANVEEAIALVTTSSEVEDEDEASKDLIEELLSMDFGKLVGLSENENVLTAAIDGTMLLNVFGLDFDLGNATVQISENAISVEVLGAHITVTAGEEFETDTTGYIEILPYAQTILDMIRGNVLNVEVSYSTGNLSISGTIAFDISALVAKADLTLNYKGAEKKLSVIYKEGSVYLELDGLKLSANVEEAIALVTTSSEVEDEDEASKDLIEELLSMDFGKLVGLSENENVLTAAIDGTMLLNVFGLDFELGNATVQISESAISVEVLGAHITITAGKEFTVDTKDYIEIVPYAQTILDLIRGNVLNVEVAYSTGNLKVEGTIAFDIRTLTAKADLTLTYKGAEKKLVVIYQEGSVYLELDGLKLSANVEEAIALVTTSSGVEEEDEASKDLIEELLSMDFGKLVGLSENEDVLTAAIDGTMLLNVFGLDFELGNATVQISENAISVEVLGAHITVTAGEAFETDTTGYIEIVPYAQTILDMIRGNVLNVEVSYSTGNLSISGTIAFNIQTLTAKADLTLNYKGIEKKLGVIYQEGSIFLTLDGLKLSANVEEAIALVTTSNEVAEEDKPSKDLIEELLSMDFGKLVGLSENENVLTAAIDGTMLLNVFGLDFDLGNATVQISESAISVEVLGAHITITAGKAFEVDTKDYIEIVPYAQTILDLIQGNVLNAEVSYSTGNLSISGTIAFDISSLVAKADLTIAYKGAEKKLGVIYQEGSVYLELDGLKLSANVEEAIALVTTSSGVEEEDEASKDLIEELLSIDFGKLVGLSESEDTLTAAIDGTMLLNVFGLDIEPKEGANYTVTVQVSQEAVSLEALGASVTITAGKAFEVDTKDYIEIIPYAQTILDLVQGNVLKAEVSYSTGDLSISGTIAFNIQTLTAQADLTLKYKGIEKQLGVIYVKGTKEEGTEKGVLYLTLDGLKLSANVKEAIALVTTSSEVEEEDEASKDLIEELLSIDFGKLVGLSESEDTLTAAIDGIMLLNLFGLDIEPKEGTNYTVTVQVSQGAVSLEALGASVTITAGEEFEVDTAQYLDIVPVAQKILEIVKAKAVGFRGILTLDAGESEIVLDVKNGAIGWGEGFRLYLDATLSAAGTVHDFKVSVDEKSMKIVYGTVGAEISFDANEANNLKQKFEETYKRLYRTVGEAIVTKDGNPLPASLEDLMSGLFGKVVDTASKLNQVNLLQLLEAVQNSGLLTGTLDGLHREMEEKKPDFTEILNEIVLQSCFETGEITAQYGGLRLAIATDLANSAYPGRLRASATYAGDSFGLTASELYVSAAETFPEMPSIHYLGYEEYGEMLDFFGAAVETLSEENVGLTLSGTVLSKEQQYASAENKKYEFNATVNYFSGTREVDGKKVGAFPFVIDTENHSITVNTDLYLKLHLELKSAVAECLWLDFVVMDMDPNGKTDGGLDFYVSISKYEAGQESYKPLSFYAPASEVRSLLSAACILLGVRNDDSGNFLTDFLAGEGIELGGTLNRILSEYLIEKNLSLKTRQGLESIGDSLKLGSILANTLGLGKKEEKGEETAAVTAAAQVDNSLRRNYLKELFLKPELSEAGAVIGNALTLKLNGQALYGSAAAEDFSLTLKKEGESFVSSRLTGVELSGLTSGQETTSFTLGFTYEKQDSNRQTLSVTHDFSGVERLINSLVKSATHDATQEEIISGEANADEYVLNRNFYIEGTASLSVVIAEVNVKIIAISVSIDKEDKVAVNLRLGYDGLYEGIGRLGVVLINGDSTVDITIKDGMVYMKRVQTSYFKKKTLTVEETNYQESEYITIYRVTTLDNFFADILQHLGFLLNFGEKIQNAIDGSEPAEPTDTTGLDYGALVSNYFLEYTSTHKENADDTWTVTLNGSALTNGVLNEIGVTFTADQENVIRTLHVSTKLYKVISLTLDLNWKNPRSEKGDPNDLTDRTFADKVASKDFGLGEQIAENFKADSEAEQSAAGEKLRFLEVYGGRIDYSYKPYGGGNTVSMGSELVFFENNTSQKLLNEPKVPDLKDYDDGHEFYLVWDDDKVYHKGENFSGRIQSKSATQKAYEYTVTFVCDEAQAGSLVDGLEWREDAGALKFTYQMKYHAKVAFTVDGKTVEEQEILSDTVIVLPQASKFNHEAAGEWNLESISITGATLSAFYPLTVRYKSVISYNASELHNANENYDVEVKDSDYKLITPTAAGYTFLGWFRCDEGAWRKVEEAVSTTVDEGKLMLTIHALWVSDLKLDIKSASQGNWFTANRQNSATVEVGGGELWGPAQAASNLTVKMDFTYFVNDKQDSNDRSYSKTNTYDKFVKSDQIVNCVLSRKKYILCEVSMTLSWDGIALTAEPLKSLDSWKY